MQPNALLPAFSEVSLLEMAECGLLPGLPSSVILGEAGAREESRQAGPMEMPGGGRQRGRERS